MILFQEKPTWAISGCKVTNFIPFHNVFSPYLKVNVAAEVRHTTYLTYFKSATGKKKEEICKLHEYPPKPEDGTAGIWRGRPRTLAVLEQKRSLSLREGEKQRGGTGQNRPQEERKFLS